MESTAHPSTEELLAGMAAGDRKTLGRLHRRMEAAAATEGVLDVAYRRIDTPVGRLLVAATGQGLVRVAYGAEHHDVVLQTLSVSISPRVLEAPGRLDPVARQLEEYFAGRRRAFELPLDFRLSKGFRLGVLHHLSEIAYGTTESYAQVAAATGSPNAVRAVGTACATNPLPVVVPCHRVIRSDGSFGGYGGGSEAKQILLALEAGAA